MRVKPTHFNIAWDIFLNVDRISPIRSLFQNRPGWVMQKPKEGAV